MKIAPGIRALPLAMLFVLTRSAVSAQTLPSPWAGTDIGNPDIAGQSTYSSGTFTITVAASSISGTSDQFHFVYRPITGDVEIVARILSITAERRWAKSGVMIRESLTAESRHAMMIGSAAAGYAFQRRAQTAGGTDSTAGPATAPPGWVRLVREGDLFTAYQSTDGVTWGLVGSDTIPMGDTVYVGLPMASRSRTVAATATLDSVNVIAASLPNLPPAISITAPAANSQYTAPASIAINATATDPEGAMLSVDFYANQTLISRDTTAPYSATFTTSTQGSYSLTAVAHDAAGNSTTSGAVPVTVQGAGNQVPTVRLTSPTNGSTFTAPATIWLAATASDAEGPIARLEFYSGTTLLWTEYNLPYEDSWRNVPAGTYTLTAVAYDGQGAKTTSAPVTVTVNGSNGAPTVTLTSPANGAIFAAPATINMTATASDPENHLAKVEFLSGTTVLGTDTTAPFAWSWSNVAAGIYSLTAKAYDTAGAVATSAVITVTVGTTTTAPRLIVFTASIDHATNVTSYFFEVFAAGANPSTAVAIASSDLGKPTPDSTNTITVDRSALFSALAPGNYVATVTAIGPGGRTRGAAVTFTR
jgi:hypothetical protein